ncbi:hypothetical protein EOM89_12075, partial [Candidatus Falkowbacteria bacterium]|nr:hypothetical protein [Candidatus Falkowbacteria bacterium]
WQSFTVAGGKLDEKGQSIGWKISKSTFRAIVDSALGLDPRDESPAAKAKRVLPGLRARQTSIDLRLREAQTDALTEGLLRGQLDAIVIATPVAGDDTISAALFQDRFVLAGHADRLAAPMAARGALRPDAIDPDQLILLDEGHCLADQALEVCALDRSRRRFDLGAASLATLAGLVGQGAGLTLLPELALATETAANPGLRLMRFAAPEPERQIRLVRRAATDGAGWFDELAAVLSEAGQKLTAAARAQVPLPAP